MGLAHDWISATNAQLADVPLSPAQEKAVQVVLQKTFRSPEEALRVFYEILRQEPSDAVIKCLAIGPMSELLMIHGQPYVKRLIADASQIPRLRSCLEHVDVEVEDCPAILELQSFLTSDNP